MTVVFTLQGIQAVNSVRDGVIPLPGNKLQITKFKTTTGTNEPSDVDTVATFEADGVVTYTGTASNGQVTNKVILNANTFQIDLVIPPEEPLAGGSFNVVKVGLYIQDPDNLGQDILLASTKFNSTFVKEAPSPTSAGNSLILTLSLSVDAASDVLEVMDASDRDFNLVPIVASVASLGIPAESVNRVTRVLKDSPVAGTGKHTFLVHSTKTTVNTAAEWLPDNHSLLFPINDLASMTNGVPSDNKTHNSSTLRLLYYHSDLTLTANHVINKFPPSIESLLISFFVDNPARVGSTEGVGGKMRHVVAVAQNLYYDDPINGPTNNGPGNELISITLGTPITPLPALNQPIKIWVANTALVPGSGTGGSGSSSGGTPDPTPNTLMRRNAGGQAEVGTPTSQSHIATKGYTDTAVLVVSNSLATHLANAAAHPEIMSTTATPSKVVKRDANGRSEIVAPISALQIANKTYVDDQSAVIQAALLAQVNTILDTAMTAFLNANLTPGWLTPAFTTHNADLNAHSDLLKTDATPNRGVMRNSVGGAKIFTANSPSADDIANVGYVNTKVTDILTGETNPFTSAATDLATPNKLAVRNSSGQSSFADPESPTHAVNLRYLEATAPVVNPSGTPKNADVKVDDATGITRVYVYGNGSWRQVYPAQFL